MPKVKRNAPKKEKQARVHDEMQKTRSARYRRTEKGKAVMRAAALRAYRRDPLKAAYARNISQAKFHGYAPPNLTLDEVKAMYAAQTGCGVCGREVKLFVDHCHISGQVRGLLCHKCNTALGLLDDSVLRLRKAEEYLKSAKVIEISA